MADVCGNCHMVIERARYCPHCGSASDGSAPRRTIGDYCVVGLLVFLIVLLGFIGTCSAVFFLEFGTELIGVLPLSAIGFFLATCCFRALRRRLRPQAPS